MLRARYCRYTLLFKNPAVTSRDTLTRRDTYYIEVWHEESPEVRGLGECALFKGLGDDDVPDYEERLADMVKQLNNCRSEAEIVMPRLTSMKFGLETALADLRNGGTRRIYPTPWSEGKGAITINGLIWMGNAEQMLHRIKEKLAAGFRCVKLKIGGINFDKELKLLSYIRERFSADELQLRLDANGAFTPANALARLEALAHYDIHSIEQPIKPRQWEALSKLCSTSPIAIALDEELIGLHSREEKVEMLEAVKPQYVILKPSLCGGFSGANEWIALAEERGIDWWATSALESNIGLNAIAQWVSTYHPTLPQGLGTGALYVNNIESPLVQEHDYLRYKTNESWKIPNLDWQN